MCPFEKQWLTSTWKQNVRTSVIVTTWAKTDLHLKQNKKYKNGLCYSQAANGVIALVAKALKRDKEWFF